MIHLLPRGVTSSRTLPLAKLRLVSPDSGVVEALPERPGKSGKPWSEMDLKDLHDYADAGVAWLATYLMRDREEVQQKLIACRLKRLPPRA